jgi:ankyrin repeat protein
LHFALLADAPRVAADLMKNGADISHDMAGYPDVSPLYLTLPRSSTSNQTELDLALRIASSYALPRTTAYLLKRGANVNAVNTDGITALHTAVMRRNPWNEFDKIGMLVNSQSSADETRWESMLLQTVSALLDFGANTDIQTQPSGLHYCDPKCWLSVDCNHQGETALHIASASGILAVVSRLLDAGADPNMPDGQGYTALYPALVQEHQDVARQLLKYCDDKVNPIVSVDELSTALHVACRFAFTKMVDELLDGGADKNVVDSHGRTPRQDVLAWARSDRDYDVSHTLRHLDGPDPAFDFMSVDLIPPPKPKTMYDMMCAKAQSRAAKLDRDFRSSDATKETEMDTKGKAKVYELSRNTTRTTAPETLTWSEPNSANLMNHFKTQAPAEKEPQFWGRAKKQTAGTGKATGDWEQWNEAQAEMGKGGTGRNRNRKRWVPLEG